jgi:hypothetical protein
MCPCKNEAAWVPARNAWPVRLDTDKQEMFGQSLRYEDNGCSMHNRYCLQFALEVT